MEMVFLELSPKSISEKLIWLPHIKNSVITTKKALAVLYMLKRNSSGLLPFPKLNLCKRMVLPNLIFASPVSSVNITVKRLLESVQKKFCKWSLGNEISSRIRYSN